MPQKPFAVKGIKRFCIINGYLTTTNTLNMATHAYVNILHQGFLHKIHWALHY